MNFAKWAKDLSPLLAGVLVAGSVAASLSGYEPTVYPVTVPEVEAATLAPEKEEKPSRAVRTTSPEAAAAQEELPTEIGNGSFDVPDGSYEGSGTGCGAVCSWYFSWHLPVPLLPPSPGPNIFLR